IRGTLCSWTRSAVSRQAARIGNAPFLFPDARMRPWSGRPPSMTKLSAARPMTAVWDIAVAYPGRGSDTRTRLGDPDQVHAERGPSAPCACGRGLDRLVRQALRRRRGALAGRRAPARFRLRDPSDPRPAPSGRSADPERRGLSGGSDRGGAADCAGARPANRRYRGRNVSPQFDFFGVAVSDMARSVAFYRVLGLEFPEGAETEQHVEAPLPGGMRYALDAEEVIRSFDPEWKRPT